LLSTPNTIAGATGRIRQIEIVGRHL
jgi:hypothetical protein